MHYGCRCIQREIEPGEKAPFDFVNYRELLKNMPHDQQVAAMGASNYKLLESGLVNWEDIVTENRVRDFREVVARNKLTVRQMTDRGVKKYQAEEAYRSVHTAAHQAAEQHRQQLLRNLTAAGMSQQALVRELSNRLAERVTLAPGPTGPYTAGPAWGGGTVPVPGHVEELAALLKGFKPPPPPPGSAPPTAPQRGPKPAGPAPAAPSTARVTEFTGGDFEATSQKLFGRVLSNEELANIAGLPDGEVKVRVRPNGLVTIRGRNAKGATEREIATDEDGGPVLYAVSFSVHKEFQGHGIGGDVFSRMVDQAARLGMNQIRTSAGRSDTDFGYHVWPRFGYDVHLSDAATDGLGFAIEALPAHLRGAQMLSDLMTTKEGRDWWTKHGSTTDMTFDLTPGSRSMQVWEEYRRQKAGSSPTSAPPT
jgi:GNAT superfamily N-acetyltransferase